MVFRRPLRPDLPYRPNVGIMLISPYGLLWLGERVDLPGLWQMPQGGVDQGETIEQAFLRELEEETGVIRSKVSILRVSHTPLRYDFPPHVMRRQAINEYRGQEQHWVAGRFLGTDADINVNTEDPEFRDWRWVTREQLLNGVAPFKRETYTKVFREFRDLFPDED